MNAPKFLTREEVAVAGRCSRDQVDRAIRAGQLEAIKPSPRRVLVSALAVERWLAARPLAAKAERAATPNPRAV